MNNHPRFWSTETLEHREIVAVAANDYGDILLTLDGGEVWRFTPHTPTPPPDAKRVKLAGHMRHSVTKALAPNAIIMLRAPEEKIGGNLKIIPAPSPGVKPSRSHAERAKARRTVKDKGDRRKVKAYFVELERQGYTATGAYKEIARQAAKGQLGSKALSEHYIGITDKVVRRIIAAPD